MSAKNMTMVAPMPVTTAHVPNSFGLRYHRSSSEQVAAAAKPKVGRTSSSSGIIPSRSRTSSSRGSGRQHELTSLENIAAELELKLSTSPSADFEHLVYGEGSHPVPLLKSRSLPNFNRDPLKSNASPKPPLRKAKSVRFADTQGLPLVEAVHQLTIKDSSYTTNKIVPYDDQEDILGGQPLIINTPKAARVCSSNPAPRTLPLKNGHSPVPNRRNSPNKLSTHKHTFTFAQPSLEPDFFERVERDSVVLESIREEPRSLHGIVRVYNLSYSKEVTIRWSHDGWRTSHDTNGVFCSNDGNTDRFAFELPINGDDVSFAIRYKVESGEFWDNNRGENYTITSS